MKLLKDLALVLVFWGFAIGPFGANIWKLINLDFEAPHKAEAIRTIGILIPPAGWVVGWMSDESLGE